MRGIPILHHCHHILIVSPPDTDKPWWRPCLGKRVKCETFVARVRPPLVQHKAIPGHTYYKPRRHQPGWRTHRYGETERRSKAEKRFINYEFSMAKFYSSKYGQSCVGEGKKHNAQTTRPGPPFCCPQRTSFYMFSVFCRPC